MTDLFRVALERAGDHVGSRVVQENGTPARTGRKAKLAHPGNRGNPRRRRCRLRTALARPRQLPCADIVQHHATIVLTSRHLVTVG